MNATKGKILAALWLAGALVGLLAILALPGRWIGSDSAEAHSSTGGPDIEFVDSKGGHNLRCPSDEADIVNEDACPSVDPRVPIMEHDDEGLETNTWTDLSLNYDQDGDGKFDTYLLKSGSHARLVVHVTGAFDDVPDNTPVNFDVKEGGIAIIGFSRCYKDKDGNCDGLAGGSEGDADQNIVADSATESITALGTTKGTLTKVSKVSFVTAETVSDFDWFNGGPCSEPHDTCIDNDADTGTDKGDNPDGIAMIDVQCPFHKTKSVVSAKVIIGANTYRAEITILCAGPQVALEIETLSWKHHKPQSVIATYKAARDGSDKGYGGDPDLFVTVTTVDSGGNPVPKQQVICEIVDLTNQDRSQAALVGLLDTDPGDIPYIQDDQKNDSGSYVGPAPYSTGYLDDIFNQFQEEDEDSPYPAGVKGFTVETRPDNKNGTITIICFVDKNKTLAFEADEINNTTEIRLASQPATVELEGPDKISAGELVTYTVQVLDKTGEGVANLTNCHWSPVDPSPGTNAVFVGDVDDQEKVDTETQDGKTDAQLFTVGPGSTGITVLCGEAKAARVVTINPAAGVVVTKGDVDKDGVISVFDALAILQDAAGVADVDFPDNADVDNDGDVDVLDALATLIIVAGG